MEHVRPIHIMHDEGVTDAQMSAVQSGVSEVLLYSGVQPHVPVKNLGVWRTHLYRPGEELMPFTCVDWYVEQGRICRKFESGLNASTMLDLMIFEPWRNLVPHYDLLIVSQDIHPNEGARSLLGISRGLMGGVVSTYVHTRSRHLAPRARIECLKTTVMHELGHVFGLVREEAPRGLRDVFGQIHCRNTCVMRQRTNRDGWEEMTYDRLTGNAFCKDCVVDLRAHFDAPLDRLHA